jgi:hypothetical protein
VLTGPRKRARRACELVGLGLIAEIEPDLEAHVPMSRAMQLLLIDVVGRNRNLAETIEQVIE